MNRNINRAAAAMAAVLVTSISAAGALAEDRQRNVIVKVSPKDLTPAMIRLIADLGVPSEVDIAAGQTLGEIVQKHCGWRDPNFIEMLKERSVLPGVPHEKITADYRFQDTTRLSLPHCLFVKQTEETSSDWLYDWVLGQGPDTEYGVKTGWDTTPAVMAPRWLGKDAWEAGSPYVVQGETPIAGLRTAAGLPRHAMRKAVKKPVSDKAEFHAIRLREGVDGDKSADQLAAQSGKHAHRQQIGIHLETVLSSGKDLCLDPSSDLLPEKYPVDAYAILRVLGLNRAVKPENMRDPTPIVIGDSGLYRAQRNNWLAAAQLGADYDYTPDPKYVWHQHGTYVATAALGGPYFARFAKMLNLKVHARNIISSIDGCQKIVASVGASERPPVHYGCEIDDNKLTPLVSPEGTGGLIVNLSISHAGRLKSLEDALKDGKNKYLVVVAAGNTGAEILPNTYPQMLPQDGHQTNVLVVAATESNGKTLAKQSSRHSAVVELAAPGCKVPVYEFSVATNSFNVIRQSGTSLAAPLVSLAAALIGGQKDLSMPLVKKRLLISADYEPDLSGAVKNAAKLNIERALALFHDVVELKDGRRFYGKFMNGDDFLLPLCGGSFPRNRAQLRSLTIYKEDKQNAQDMIFFYYGNEEDQSKEDAQLQHSSCLLRKTNVEHPEFDLSEFPMTIDDFEAPEGIETKKEPVEFTLGDVKNITLAYEPYWKH